jgi:hypothetical protein
MKRSVYIFSVLLLMMLLPIASIVTEYFFRYPADIIGLIGKWFVFWVVGIRLFSAGIKQSLNPYFTLEKIFDIHHLKSSVIVRELGFANICMGVLGIISLFSASFRLPTAIAGGLFLGLAGIMHAIRKPASQNEVIAMISNLFVFIILTIYIIYALTNNI